MKDCIFCKIVKGEIPSYKIWESEDYIAVLDIYPNIRGQTLVIPKRHISSYAFGLEDDVLVHFIKTTKKVANLLEKKLPVQRVHLVLEGVMVSHLHAKLFPAIGFDEFIVPEPPDGVFYSAYPRFVTSLPGPKAKEEDLRVLQKQLTE